MLIWNVHQTIRLLSISTACEILKNEINNTNTILNKLLITSGRYNIYRAVERNFRP